MEKIEKSVKKPKLSIKHYLNTKLKPHKRRDTDDFFIYPVYSIVRYKQQNTKLKSAYYPMFSEKEFAENPVPNDFSEWWVNLEKEIITQIINEIDSDNSFSINLLPHYYQLYSKDIIQEAVKFIIDYNVKYGQFGQPTGIDFSSLVRFLDKIVDYQNFHIITVFDWTFKPETKEKYKTYLKTQIIDNQVDNYITDIIYLLDKISLGTLSLEPAIKYANT